MTEKEIEEIRSQFYHCKDKKILIYGTKVYAKKLLTALYDFHIIGVLDQYQLEGTLHVLQPLRPLPPGDRRGFGHQVPESGEGPGRGSGDRPGALCAAASSRRRMYPVRGL